MVRKNKNIKGVKIYNREYKISQYADDTQLFLGGSENSLNRRAMMALGRSPEYHWNQIISKSVHPFSRRSRLKLFFIYSPGGHFVQQIGMV